MDLRCIIFCRPLKDYPFLSLFFLPCNLSYKNKLPILFCGNAFRLNFGNKYRTFKAFTTMKKIAVTLVALLMISCLAISQNIIVNETPAITQLVEKHIELNRAQSSIDGWRIQLFATTDRSKLEGARGTFINRYPNIPVDWVHASPWYRLRAGAFATKLDATRALNSLKIYYPDAYLAKDKIKTSELLNSRI